MKILMKATNLNLIRNLPFLIWLMSFDQYEYFNRIDYLAALNTLKRTLLNSYNVLYIHLLRWKLYLWIPTLRKNTFNWKTKYKNTRSVTFTLCLPHKEKLKIKTLLINRSSHTKISDQSKNKHPVSEICKFSGQLHPPLLQ